MSSSETPETRLTIRSPAELAGVVPYLIGFHPGDGSLVVIVLAHARVLFAARADLPDSGAPAAEVGALADHLVPVVQSQRQVSDVVLIGYGTAEHIDPALRVVEQTFAAADIPIRDLLRVTGSRIFPITCGNPSCCPPHGFPFDPAASAIAVQATVAGCVAFPDRAAVAARIAPVDGAARERMRKATTRALTRLESLVDAGRAVVSQAGAHALDEALRAHDAGQCLTDDQVAWLTVLLTGTPVRDRAVELTQPHEGHVTFWTDITRRAERRFVPVPATLLALTAWRCGNGTLATMAAERALRVDPGYELAGLLLKAFKAGLPPSTYEQAVTDDAHRTTENPDTATRQPGTDKPEQA